MRISQYVAKASKLKQFIPDNRWVDLKQYYMSMYHYYLLKLYDMNYISDPTRFDEKEIRRNFYDLNITYFVNSMGSISLTSDFAKLAYYKEHDSEEVGEFLKYLYYMLKYKEYCEELDKQFELDDSKFSPKLVVRNVSKITSGTSVKYNKGVIQLLMPDGYTVTEHSCKEEIFDMAMELLQISKDAYCDGMFVKGLTHEQEVDLCHIILEGFVKLDGIYSKRLYDWLMANKWSKSSRAEYNLKGLYSQTFVEKADAINDMVDRVTTEVGEQDLVLFYEDRYYTRTPINYYKIPIGHFVVLTTSVEEDLILSEYNSLYGFTGEVYSMDYLRREDKLAVGVPIIVNNNGIETYVFDVSQVEMDFEQNTWFTQGKVSFDFDDRLSLVNPYTEGTIEYELFQAFTQSGSGDVYKIKAPEKGFAAIRAARKKVTSKIIKMLR